MKVVVFADISREEVRRRSKYQLVINSSDDISMGKQGDLSITFENNRQVYAPGDVVKAFVVLNLKKSKKVKKIKVNTVGESIVKVKKPDGKQLRSAEKYFHYTFDVYTGGDRELSIGKHTFPFQFSLKAALPTSFEGKGGHVRYSIQADAEYPGMFSSKSKAVTAFTVLDVVDLNALSTSRGIQTLQCEKHASGMLWWKQKAVTVHLKTAKTGFVPGEFVMLNGLIVNGRSRPIRNLCIELIQLVSFHGREKSSPSNSQVQKHDVTSSVAEWNMSPATIDGNSAANWENKKLFQIPPLISSGLRNCKLIDVQYFLKITVGISGSLGTSYITGKSNYLTIGTVPLVAPRTRAPPRPPQPTAVASAPTMMEMPPELCAPPPYDPGNYELANVPLPTYEEAITGGAALTSLDNDDAVSVISDSAESSGQFVPQYAFYDFNQVAGSTGPVEPSAPPAEL